MVFFVFSRFAVLACLVFGAEALVCCGEEVQGLHQSLPGCCYAGGPHGERLRAVIGGTCIVARATVDG